MLERLHRSGPGKLNKLLSGKSAINKAHERAFKGAEDGKKNETETFSDIQS